jgi:HD-GYP domain-containing protein (c-di-GMP phosphodiesterase class II)
MSAQRSQGGSRSSGAVRGNDSTNGVGQTAQLRDRFAPLGIAMFDCDQNGESRWTDTQSSIAKLCHASPLFLRELKKAVVAWAKLEDPSPKLIVPGLWLVPIPLVNRRKRTGYSVALIPTPDFLDCEQFCAMCQSAKLDMESCRTRLAQDIGSAANHRKSVQSGLPGEITRLAGLIRTAHQDQLRAATDAQSMEAVGKQLADSYEEINLLYTITQSMTVQERPERFIALACKELLATLSYAWIGLQFSNDRQKLKSLAGRLIFAGAGPSTPNWQQTVRTLALKLLAKANPKEPIVLEPHAKAEDKQFAPLGATALAHPIMDIRTGDIIGLLIAGDKRGADTAVTNIDIKLLGATVTHMAIFLENAALYDDLSAMFLGTLEALTASIDAKDRYTCGHSRRVAHLTQALAEQIGLDEYTVARCHIAGLVHDVGKIGVPETVLTKPGKLTDDEFAWIRKHPEIGYRILKDIPQLSDVLPGVLHHHERWDGKGYPEGLSGEAIPLVARLIALADSFDAMSSTRTYRAAMSRDAVLKEIENCAGKQFDATLARAFIKLDFEMYDRMSREHQTSETDGSFAGLRIAVAAPSFPHSREKAA